MVEQKKEVKPETTDISSKSPSPEPELDVKFSPIKISEDTEDESKCTVYQSSKPKQDDPFLRDLTACIQLKQQKKLNELKPANELGAEIKPSSTSSKTFAKPNFNLLEPAKSQTSTLKTSSNFSLSIKTPVSSKKCFLNISVDKPEAKNNEQTEKPVLKQFTPIGFKCVKKETKLNLNSLNSLSQVSTSTSPMVSKATPVTSFTLASMTPLRQHKVYTTSSTNTENIVVQTVATNTQLEEGVKSLDKISESVTEIVLKGRMSLRQKNESTQTKMELVKTRPSPRYFRVDKFLDLMLQNEYNKSDMEFLKIILGHLIVWLNSPLRQIQNSSKLIKSYYYLNKINNLMINNGDGSLKQVG